MSEHRARILWDKTNPNFAKGRYSREHTWEFDCGVSIAASPSPATVPVPFSNPENVDPEEAFVAAISSCHMLTFLYLAANAGFHIDSYEDEAVGEMTRNENGTPWVSEVTLNPRIVFSGAKLPTARELQKLHDDAHDQCFIANSVKTEIIISTLDE